MPFLPNELNRSSWEALLSQPPEPLRRPVDEPGAREDVLPAKWAERAAVGALFGIVAQQTELAVREVIARRHPLDEAHPRPRWMAREDNIAGAWVAGSVGEAIEEHAFARLEGGTHAGAADTHTPGSNEGCELIEDRYAGEEANQEQGFRLTYVTV